MRIVGGYLKGRRLKVPKNFHSRPTTDFAKEGLFNVLENNYNIEDKKILDLCSGTGNIAFEFISRGSNTVTCVDSSFNSIRFIKKNASELNIIDFLYLVKSDIIKFINRNEISYDFVFADPPYVFDKYEQLIELVLNHDSILNSHGVFILEHGRDHDFANCPYFSFIRKYGNVNFSFFIK